MPGTWQDPQIHLLSAAAGRSTHTYHDVDFVGNDTIEKDVVAGTQDGK